MAKLNDTMSDEFKAVFDGTQPVGVNPDGSARYETPAPADTDVAPYRFVTAAGRHDPVYRRQSTAQGSELADRLEALITKRQMAAVSQNGEGIGQTARRVSNFDKRIADLIGTEWPAILTALHSTPASPTEGLERECNCSPSDFADGEHHPFCYLSSPAPSGDAVAAVPSSEPPMSEQLAALIKKATDSDLTDGGRYFNDYYTDLTKCRHGDTGEYDHKPDGELVEFLWNNRVMILGLLMDQA